MTLDSHEIRLGNTYKVSLGDGTHTTDMINLEDIENLLDDPIDDFYQALEISEEWLLKVGFKKNDHKYMDNYIIPISAGYWHSVNYDNEDCEWYYNNDYSDASCYYVASVKYAHQLENLYFALTGKELTYGC